MHLSSICSPDGMHPSRCGYAIIASEAMKLLGLKCDPVAMLREALQEDTLLSRYPGELDFLVHTLRILHTIQQIGDFTHAPVAPSPMAPTWRMCCG